MKQAKEEAQEEIEKYRKERERQFREFEAKHMGSREDVAAKIDQDTKQRIDDMNRAVASHKEPVRYSFRYTYRSLHFSSFNFGYKIVNNGTFVSFRLCKKYLSWCTISSRRYTRISVVETWAVVLDC